MCAAPGSKTAQLIEMLHSDMEVPFPGEDTDMHLELQLIDSEESLPNIKCHRFATDLHLFGFSNIFKSSQLVYVRIRKWRELFALSSSPYFPHERARWIIRRGVIG